MSGTYNNLNEDTPGGGGQPQGSGNKGDISQQIMDSHGSRVKKYGIYIDQLVDKIKVVQASAQDLFDIISSQTAVLIDLKKNPDPNYKDQD